MASRELLTVLMNRFHMLNSFSCIALRLCAFA
jgi:hypothetical protein